MLKPDSQPQATGEFAGEDHSSVGNGGALCVCKIVCGSENTGTEGTKARTTDYR